MLALLGAWYLAFDFGACILCVLLRVLCFVVVFVVGFVVVFVVFVVVVGYLWWVAILGLVFVLWLCVLSFSVCVLYVVVCVVAMAFGIWYFVF